MNALQMSEVEITRNRVGDRGSVTRGRELTLKRRERSGVSDTEFFWRVFVPGIK